MRTVTIAGKQFRLTRPAIERAVARALPEPVRDHFVVVAGRRWPPKQVLALATGLDRADFTTHQARRILSRLGFAASRVRDHGARASGTTRGRPAAAVVAAVPESAVADAAAQPGSLVDALRPFVGQWVAIRGDEVLVAAPAPRHVVAWLAEHGQQAQSVFRVPDSEQAIGGAAPL
jgi:hypothetical protein